jgi:gamma-glutamyl hercynylcysteine S-oxide synthase
MSSVRIATSFQRGDSRNTPEFEWCDVPMGPALMGSNRAEEFSLSIVDVAAFRITRFAITNEQFRPFVTSGGYETPDFWAPDAFEYIRSLNIVTPAFWFDDKLNHDDQPVTGVSFFEAAAFARWAGARVPTECEWMKAAAGPTGRTYPWGEEEPTSRFATFAPDFSPTSFAPAAASACADGDSPYGCRQMAGNLFEWCADVFHSDTLTGPRDSATRFEVRTTERHLLKGGAWTTGAGRLRVAARWLLPAQVRDNVMGIRLVSDAHVQSRNDDGHD